jgi:hypothetical protein
MHFRVQNITLVLDPFEINHHANHNNDQQEPMQVGHQPIANALTTAMTTWIPIVQNVIKGRRRRIFRLNVRRLFAQIKPTQLGSSYRIRTHVRVQIRDGLIVLSPMIHQIPIVIANL